MTRRCVRAAFVAILLLVSRLASAQPLQLHITLSTGTVGAKCMAMMSAADKAPEAKPGQQVIWHVDGSMCSNFSRSALKLDFDTPVMVGLSGCVSTGSSANACDITGTVAASTTGTVPNKSRHPYVIRFRGRNAGDPEIDINDGSGAPPPPVAAPGAGRAGSRGRRGQP